MKKIILYLSVVLFSCGMVGAVGADLPMTAEQQRKKQQIQQQLKCLKNCQDRAYKGFYSCGTGGLYCNMRVGLNYRVCVDKCNVAWFCEGFRTAVGTKCPTMCLQEAKKASPRKNWSGTPTRKQFEQWKRRYIQWQKRSRHACHKICESLHQSCNFRQTVVLPPPSRVPNFKDIK